MQPAAVTTSLRAGVYGSPPTRKMVPADVEAFGAGGLADADGAARGGVEVRRRALRDPVGEPARDDVRALERDVPRGRDRLDRRRARRRAWRRGGPRCAATRAAGTAAAARTSAPSAGPASRGGGRGRCRASRAATGATPRSGGPGGPRRPAGAAGARRRARAAAGRSRPSAWVPRVPPVVSSRSPRTNGFTKPLASAGSSRPPGRVIGTRPFSSSSVMRTPASYSCASAASTPFSLTARSTSPSSTPAWRSRGRYGLLGCAKTPSRRVRISACSRRPRSALTALRAVSRSSGLRSQGPSRLA